MAITLKNYAVVALPQNPEPNAFYYVLTNGRVEQYLTNAQGVPIPVSNTQAVEDIVADAGFVTDAAVLQQLASLQLQINQITGGGTPAPVNSVIVFNSLPAKNVGDAPFSANVTSNNTESPIVLSSSDPAVATVSGQTITIVGAGTAQITANQASSAHFNAATPVSQTLTVSAAVDTTALPALAAPTAPPGVTAPGSAFTLTANATPNAATPQIAEYNRNDNTKAVNKTVTVNVTAENLNGTNTNVRVFDGSSLQNGSVVNAAGQFAGVKLPGSAFKARVLWLGNGNGYGKPVILNTAIAIWAQTSIVAGQPARVYGKNLANGNVDGSTNSNVYIQSTAGGAVQQCTVTDVTPYRVQYTVPNGLANGSYWIWVHNGHGGAYGWSKKLTVNVISQSSHVKYKVWGATNNVAAPSGSASSDVSAINSAVSAAGTGGNVVQLQSGIYQVNGTLNLNSVTKWKGTRDGSGNITTRIKITGAFSNPNEGLFNRSGSVNTVMFEDIIFECNGFSPDTAAGNSDAVFMHFGASSMIYFKNCVIDARGKEAYRQNGGENNIFFEGTRIIGGSWSFGNCMFFAEMRQFFMFQCTIELTNDAGAWIGCKDFSEFDIWGNTIKDLDNSTTDGSGWGKGRAIAAIGVAGRQGDGYIAGNTCEGLGTRQSGTNTPDANSGEVWLWEGNAAVQRMNAVSATATTVTFGSTVATGVNDVRQLSIQIMAGKGVGQFRRILSGQGSTTITVDAWDVVPDSTSVIEVGPFVDNIVIYKNVINANGKSYIAQNANGNSTASAGANFYGGCSHCVFDGNTVTATRTGFQNNPTQHNNNSTDANLFIDCLNNSFINTRWAYRIAMDHAQGGTRSSNLPMVIGSRVDGNTFSGTISQNLNGQTFRPDLDYWLPELNMTYQTQPIVLTTISNNVGIGAAPTIYNWWGTDSGQGSAYPKPSAVTATHESMRVVDSNS